MLLSPKKWSVLGLLLLSSQAMASTSTASFNGVANYANSPSFSLTNDGVGITVSGWSDTTDEAGQDLKIAIAKDLGKYGSNGNYGWGITANDPNEDSSPEHAADNRYVDSSAYGDYDFFMITFDQEVTLTGASFTWAWKGTNATQVSIAALNNSVTDLTNKTWQGIKNSDTLGSGYAQMQYSSGYYIDTNVNQSSKVWLLGAFNSVFGGNSSWEGNDGFKLAGISYKVSSTPTPGTIPEPSSIAMLGLALFGLTLNRRKKLH